VNILDEIKGDLRAILFPIIGQDIPLAVIETIEALWEEKKRPQIHAKKKTPTGYTFTIALPPGVAFKDFCAKLDYFRDSAGGNKVNVNISQSGKMAILTISTNILGDFYAYPVDYPRDGILPIPIGYSTKGLEIIDLAKHEHVLIGGETGSGKTTCLNVIIVSLLSLQEPPILIVIDLKKSGDYCYLDDRVLLITDRVTACQALERVLQEMRKRQQILYDSRCKDIHTYNKHGGKMPWLVLIIDELAQLKNEDAQETLEDLLSLSRASGVRIIAATQRPSAKIFKAKSFGDAKANFTITICYRTRSAIDSRVILGTGEGVTIPKIPGRGLLQIGCDLIEIQTPHIDPEEVMQIDQFSPSGVSKELAPNRNINGVGSAGHSANNTLAIPFLSRCTAKIKSLVRGRKD
jgi:S-DNA-T family DNA segregation ATPase FtsK/SpoIIIE